MTKSTATQYLHKRSIKYQWDNPGIFYDRFGHSVDTRCDVWELTDPSLTEFINWGRIQVDCSLVSSFKTYVSHCIEVKSPRTARNIFNYILELSIKCMHCWCYPLQLKNMQEMLTYFRSDNNEHKFHWIRKWYVWCADVEIPGFYQEIADELLTFKLEGNEKGRAVLIDDEEEGPLDNVEYDLLRSVIKKKVGSLLERVCIMLCMELGANPKNYVLIEERDFIKNQVDSCQAYYSLSVPRIKKRTANRSVRLRKISKYLGEAIEELISGNVSNLDRCFEEKSPILWRKYRRSFSSQSLKRFEHHLTTSEFSLIVTRYAKTANIVSPRTGDLLHLSPRRLRYTFATRLVEQGASPSVVADALDHTDLQHVGVYFKARGQIVGDLDKALDSNPHYQDIINKFRGVVVEREQTADLPTIPGETPTYRTLGGIGGCGAKTICRLYPPLSCYLCPSFQAWKDGPHQEVLNELKLHARQMAETSGSLLLEFPIKLMM